MNPLTLTSRVAAIALCLVISLPVAAEDKPRSALEHFEHVQKIRHDLDKAIHGAATTERDLRAAVTALQGAIDYLAKSEVRELATGNVYLSARWHDVHVDLAAAYARLGDKDKALDALDAARRQLSTPALGRMITRQKEFASLWNEPRFKALMAKIEMVDVLWNTPNIATPYRERLSVEERVAGLSLFWAEARENFVYFDNVPGIEWDRRYLEALSRVIAAETTRDYYDVLMRFAPLLNDGHTNIYPPPELADQFNAHPPIRTQRVEDKVLVTQVYSRSLAERVQVGDEVVEIDGLPVEQYAATRVLPYVSASTPQGRAFATYTYQLLNGDARHPVRLKLRNAANAERTESLARTGYSDVQPSLPFAFRMGFGGIAYLALDDFESDAAVKAFEKALPEILGANSLVIDVRRNGGGSTIFGLEILSYLTSEPIAVTTSFVRDESALDRARGYNMIRWAPVPGSGQAYVNPRMAIFPGLVAVLIGPQTFSAAEDFVVSYELMQRGLLIGEATGGSTGQALVLKLPGGGSARICIKRDTYPDGRAFVGEGIPPGIEVTESVADIRAGKDPVLERAVRELLRRQ